MTNKIDSTRMAVELRDEGGADARATKRRPRRGRGRGFQEEWSRGVDLRKEEAMVVFRSPKDPAERLLRRRRYDRLRKRKQQQQTPLGGAEPTSKEEDEAEAVEKEQKKVLLPLRPWITVDAACHETRALIYRTKDSFAELRGGKIRWIERQSTSASSAPSAPSSSASSSSVAASSEEEDERCSRWFSPPRHRRLSFLLDDKARIKEIQKEEAEEEKQKEEQKQKNEVCFMVGFHEEEVDGEVYVGGPTRREAKSKKQKTRKKEGMEQPQQEEEGKEDEEDKVEDGDDMQPLMESLEKGWIGEEEEEEEMHRQNVMNRWRKPKKDGKRETAEEEIEEQEEEAEGEEERGILFNFRDLAYAANGDHRRLKSGVLYRSACVSRRSDISKADVHRALGFLRNVVGVRTLIDLRTTAEKAKDKYDHIVEQFYPTVKNIYNDTNDNETDDTKLLNTATETLERKRYNLSPVNKSLQLNGMWWPCPTTTKLRLIFSAFFGRQNLVKTFSREVVNPMGLAGLNKLMLEHAGPEFLKIMRIIKDERNHPILVHCASGKDRTGLVCALVLGCCGVAEEAVFHNYAQSERFLRNVFEAIVEENRQNGLDNTFDGTPKSVMQETYAFIVSKWGSINAYLDSIGFSYAEQQELANLLQDGEPQKREPHHKHPQSSPSPSPSSKLDRLTEEKSLVRATQRSPPSSPSFLSLLLLSLLFACFAFYLSKSIIY